MNQHTPIRRGISLTVTLSIVLAAGCTNFGKSQNMSSAKLAHPMLNPRQVANIQLGLARTLEKQGQVAKAIAVYRQVLKLDSKQSVAMQRLAIMLDKQGRFDESAKLFRQALKQRPGDANLFCDIGYSLYLQRQFDDALMNLKQAIALQPTHKRAHNNLGLVYAQTNRYDAALAEFAKAGCKPAECHMNLAVVLTLNQNPAAAKEQYEHALAAAPLTLQTREKLQEIGALVAYADSLISKPNAATKSTKTSANRVPAAKKLSSLPPTKPAPKENAAAPAKSPFLQVGYETPALAKRFNKPNPTATSGSASSDGDANDIVFIRSNDEVPFGRIASDLPDDVDVARPMKSLTALEKTERVSRRIAIPPELLAELADPVRKAIPVQKADPRSTEPRPVRVNSATPTTSLPKSKWDGLDSGFGTWLAVPNAK